MVKNEVVKLISAMDENSSLGDIMYRLYVLDKHHKAMNDIKAGRVFTSQSVRRAMGAKHEAVVVD